MNCRLQRPDQQRQLTLDQERKEEIETETLGRIEMVKVLVELGGAMLRQEKRSSIWLKEVPSLTSSRQNVPFSMFAATMIKNSFFLDAHVALSVARKVRTYSVAKSHSSFPPT